MAYVPSFFKVMSTVQTFLNGKGATSVSSSETEKLIPIKERRETFDKLVAFIESGCFTESESEKFICQNWSKKFAQLTELWNFNHRGSSSKKESTFRSQVKTLSLKLFSLFSIEHTDLNDMFILGDEKYRDKLVLMFDICRSGAIGDLNLESSFSYSLADYLNDADPQNEYDLADCSTELQLLKRVSKNNLLSMFQSCDIDKLKYLLERMRAPLFVYESGAVELENGKTRYIPTIEFNSVKAEFCKAFASAKSIPLEVEVNVDTSLGLHVSPLLQTAIDKNYEKYFKSGEVWDENIIAKIKAEVASWDESTTVDDLANFLRSLDCSNPAQHFAIALRDFKNGESD